MRNIELFLAHVCVHADLSPFNILYWNGGIRIIDFPQSVDPRFNANAFALLNRDLDNICQFFARHGVRAEAGSIASNLWRRFLRAEL